MLSDDLGIAREDRRTVVIALVAGVTLGFLVGWVLYSGDGDPVSPRPASEGGAGGGQEQRRARRARDALSARALLGALDRGIQAVSRDHEGTADAAVAVADGKVVADGRTSTQPWQMMRVPAAIAALTAPEDGTPGFDEAWKTALRQPDDTCAEWRVLLELQQQAGDPARARGRVAEVFDRAGAPSARLAERVGQPDADCAQYLQEHGEGLTDPDGAILLLENSSWTIRDAAALARAIGTGRYGEAGKTVEQAMREDPSVDLGAGRSLAKFEPAYATGWSRSREKYQAGQIAIADVAGRKVAVAAVYRPDEQPAGTDPTETRAPAALQAIFDELAKQFDRAEAQR